MMNDMQRDFATYLNENWDDADLECCPFCDVEMLPFTPQDYPDEVWHVCPNCHTDFIMDETPHNFWNIGDVVDEATND